MIRITTRDESVTKKLVLEGKLTGSSVAELEKCWLTSPDQAHVSVDLTSVSFVDDSGKQLLKRMYAKGVRLLSKGLMSKCLIEEIEAAVRPH